MMIKSIKLLIANLIKNCFWLISFFGEYKKIPYTKPESAALTVNPGKYGPNGNSKAPNKSPNNAITVLYFGPNQIADITIGM